MSKMNGRTRKKKYAALVKRDGERCINRFCASKKRQLVVDHIDNDNSYDDLSNLQLLCRRCNFLKNWRPVDKCVNEKEISEIKTNVAKEPKFRQYVYRQVNQNITHNYKKLINGGAELTGISPVTAKRYLDKMCSKEGLCKISNGSVIIDFDHPLYTGKIESYDEMFLAWPKSERDHSWIIHRGEPHCNSEFVLNPSIRPVYNPREEDARFASLYAQLMARKVA